MSQVVPSATAAVVTAVPSWTQSTAEWAVSLNPATGSPLYMAAEDVEKSIWLPTSVGETPGWDTAQEAHANCSSAPSVTPPATTAAEADLAFLLEQSTAIATERLFMKARYLRGRARLLRLQTHIFNSAAAV